MSTVNRFTDWISKIQSRKIFNRERCLEVAQKLFLTIGILVVVHFLYSMIYACFLLSRFLFQFILEFFSPILAFPSRMIGVDFISFQQRPLFLPIFAVCSMLSFYLTKISWKNLDFLYDRYARKHFSSFNSQNLRFFSSFCIWFLLLTFQMTFFATSSSILFQNSRSTSSLDVPIKFQLPSEEKTQTTLKSFDTNSGQIDRFDLVNNSTSINAKRQILSFDSRKTNIEVKVTSKTKGSRKLSQTEISSIYAAYTDIRCFDPKKPRNHLNYLNSYRLYSPFPIYVSIVKTNGPKCYKYYPNSSCAISPKLIYSTHLNRFLFGSLMIISLLILALFAQKHYLSSRRNHQQESISTNVSDEEIPTSVDAQVAENFRRWINQEHDLGYRNITESCRQALNQCLSVADENIRIETIQFSSAAIDQLEQDKTELTPKTLIIHGKLILDHLIITIRNQRTEQRCFIQASHYVSRIRVELIIDDDTYRIQVKFNQLYSNLLTLTDEHNILSDYEKQSIIKLVEETISQSTVPCYFHVTDNLQNNCPELPSHAELFTQRSQDYQHEDQASISTLLNRVPGSVSDSTSITTQQSQLTVQCQPDSVTSDLPIEPPVKSLLVRIVKAVKLRNVEQPYCILELNSPKQIHQTNLAKDGLNPVWDEKFIFECDERSNQIRLQLFDRRRPTKKDKLPLVDRILVDMLIPFTYVTSNRYKQDIRLTPIFPDATILIEFSTRFDDESNNKSPDQQSLSDGIISLSSEQKSHDITNRSDYPIRLPLSPTNTDDLSSFTIRQRQKKKSMLSSLKPWKSSKEKPASNEEVTLSNRESRSFSRRIQNLFRTRSKSKSKSRKKNKTINSGNFVLDRSDFISTSTPNTKKRFFFKSKQKKQSNGNISGNSLNSDDFSRSISTRNTPIRANVGRPVTMIKENS